MAISPDAAGATAQPGDAPAQPDARRRPTGRRVGDSGTRAAILAAAREHFADNGFDGASLRRIAAAADVDTALIRHFFGSKDDLFAAALDVPDEVVAHVVASLTGDAEHVGERLVDGYLALWENPTTAAPILAIARSALASRKGADRLAAVVGARLLSTVMPHVRGGDADTRAALAGAHLMGVAIARYVVRVEPLAGLPRQTLVAWVAPAVQRYLTGEPPPR